MSVHVYTYSQVREESRRLIRKLFHVEKQCISIFPEEKPWSMFSSGAQKETSSSQIRDEFVAAEYGRVIYFLMEKANTLNNSLV